MKAEHEQCFCIGTGLFEASLLSLQGVMLGGIALGSRRCKPEGSQGLAGLSVRLSVRPPVHAGLTKVHYRKYVVLGRGVCGKASGSEAVLQDAYIHANVWTVAAGLLSVFKGVAVSSGMHDVQLAAARQCCTSVMGPAGP